MKLLQIQKSFRIFTDLKFALIILAVLAAASSLGSFIEQDEAISFYEDNYKIPIYGFISAQLILSLGLDHVYVTWWFLLLLVTLAVSLISCTITRQFPLFINSKYYFFRKKGNSFL
jgi:cytochrome c biogenesis protein